MNLFKDSLVIFPLDHQLKWTSDYQQQTINLLQQNKSVAILNYHHYKDYHKFLLKKSTISFNKKIADFTPIHILPLERFAFIYNINIKLSFIIALLLGIFLWPKKNKILWIFHPRFYWMAQLIKKIPLLKITVLYDCLDYFSSSKATEEKLIRKGEYWLAHHADLITTNSFILKKKLEKISFNAIYRVPSGFRLNQYKENAPFSNRQSVTKIVGFAGALNFRIDFNLLFNICSTNSDLVFQLVGPKFIGDEISSSLEQQLLSEIVSLPNVQYIPFIEPKKLVELYSNWSVGIIPYDMSVELNKYCNPLKLMEYFYFGIPTISTQIPELSIYENKNFLVRSNITKEWNQAIKKFSNNFDQKMQSEMRKISIQNSWEAKLTAIDHLFAQTVNK